MARIDENKGAMAWAENSLRYARGRDLSRLVGLLVAVRDEIALEMELAKRAAIDLSGGRCTLATEPVTITKPGCNIPGLFRV